MEIVLLAHVTLNQIGAASSPGFTHHYHSKREFSAEIEHDSKESLKALVVQIAMSQGESSTALRALEEPAFPYDEQKNTVFVLPSPRLGGNNTPYAECRVYHAIKAKGRYFELKEVDPSTVTPFP